MTHAQVEQDDVVERYTLRRLDTEQEGAFEEHYLGCAACREELRRSREPLELILGACALESSRSRERRRFWLPAPAWGLAAALGAAALYVSVALPPVLVRWRAPAGAAVGSSLPAVELSSLRAGEEGGRVAATMAAGPFLLRLDQRGLAAGSGGAVEIAGESGELVWRGTAATVAGEWLEVRVEGGLLRVGLYWVRVQDQGRLLREYSLRVEP